VPTFEPLEPRRLYSGGSASLIGTTLDVEGTNGNDSIVMGENVSGYYFVTVNQQPAQLFSPSIVSAIVINAYQGDDSIDISAMPIGAPGVQAHAGKGNDTVIGSPANDSIWGGLGNDSLSGGAGDDWITGSLGNNTIFGGLGNDTITAGGTGNNSVNGGAGDDIIYAVNSQPDTIDGGTGNNTAYVDAGSIDSVANATAVPPS
jgi:Ca2+-binding RTX toxin-like protein